MEKFSFKDAPPLYKVDAVTKTGKNWSEVVCYPGEPIFVPNPSGQEEDGGVVLSLVLDFANRRSFLLILDAKDLTELARAEAPHAIPVGLHGLWNGRM
jgi:carotenoid cleavage dioxygenase-like enzyme